MELRDDHPDNDDAGLELMSQLQQITKDPKEIEWFLTSPKERLQPGGKDVDDAIAELQRVAARENIQAKVRKSLPASLLHLIKKLREDAGWVTEALSKTEITFIIEAAKIWFSGQPEIASEVERRVLEARTQVSPRNFTGDIFCRGRRELMKWLKTHEFPAEIRLQFMKFVAFCKGSILRVREGVIPPALLLAPSFYLAGCEALNQGIGSVKTTTSLGSTSSFATGLGLTGGGSWTTLKGGKKVAKKVKKWVEDEEEEEN